MLHGFFTFTAVFTMYFNGGMVPTYLIVKNVGLLDSVWAFGDRAGAGPGGVCESKGGDAGQLERRL